MVFLCVPVVVPIRQKTDTLSDTSTEIAHSDVEHSQFPSRSDEMSDVCEEECGACHLVVRSTFLHMDDGHSLRQTYRRLRRAKTDFALMNKDPAVYETGNFMKEHCQETRGPKASVQPSQPVAASNGKAEGQTGKSKERSTVMLRNLPNNYTREMFLEMLDEHGLKGRYDFAYLPCDFYRYANLGYAFVNMVDSKAVDELWKTFQGFSDWALPTAKVCEVSWSGPHQGFKAHIERYRNSPVMHKSVPDEYKPVIFKNGVRKPFPRPTKRIKAPF